jgi:cysteinyl-tRNA synthetase
MIALIVAVGTWHGTWSPTRVPPPFPPSAVGVARRVAAPVVAQFDDDDDYSYGGRDVGGRGGGGYRGYDDRRGGGRYDRNNGGYGDRRGSGYGDRSSGGYRGGGGYRGYNERGNDYGGSYGRGGGSGSYERAAGDTAPVDVGRVEQLLSERSSARRSRDFQAADALRDQLRDELSVEVSDRDFTWQVGRRGTYGGGGGGYGRDRGRGGGGYGDRGGYGRGGGGRGGYDRGGGRRGRGGDRFSERPPRVYDRAEFGPTGHDYEAEAAEDGALPSASLDEETVSRIDALLAQRLEARISRNFNKADDLKSQLMSLRVKINDRARTWSYLPPKDYGPLGHDYTRPVEDETFFDEETLGRINVMLKERLEAREAAKYDIADAIKEELGDLGIFINEKLRAWRADGLAFPTHVRIDSDGDDDPELSAALDEDVVMAMLSERAELRRDGRYDEADEVVESLREQYNVILDDKRGTWRCVTIRGGYYRVGPRVDPSTAKKVGELLERRTEYRDVRKYREADAIHDELSEMGVRLDTRLQTWRFVHSNEQRYG